MATKKYYLVTELHDRLTVSAFDWTQEVKFVNGNMEFSYMCPVFTNKRKAERYVKRRKNNAQILVLEMV